MNTAIQEVILAAALGSCASSSFMAVSGLAQGARGTALPVTETTLFAGSGLCARCHQGLLEKSVDVSPVTLWQASMMANSAKDPLWRAKVAAETAELPDLTVAIEQKCLACHSPSLYTQSKWDGVTFGIADLDDISDPLRPLHRDGDTCTICHQVQPEGAPDPNQWWGNSGSSSGGFWIDDLRAIFGPYPSPFISPMINTANYAPMEAYPPLASPSGAWVIDDAEHCATCHNLFTNYKIGEDENGTILSTEKFPEQTPYYEWRDSVYPSTGITCQGCHMPYTDTPIKISTAARNRISTRTPFWYHDFVGGNAFMLRILRDHSAGLEVTATSRHFNDKILTTEMMMLSAANLFISSASVDAGLLQVDVTLANLAGHKLPTGIPLRRVWLHFTAADRDGVFFESGAWDPATGEIAGLDMPFEPHRNTINLWNEVPIYEAIMADVNGDPTGVLLLAGAYLKDNRLPPLGFSVDDPHYPEIAVVGVPDADTDFDLAGGSDTVHYAVDLAASVGEPFTVTVEACYQPVTPNQAAYLASIGAASTDAFAGYYDTADKTPQILATASLTIQAGGL